MSNGSIIKNWLGGIMGLPVEYKERESFLIKLMSELNFHTAISTPIMRKQQIDLVFIEGYQRIGVEIKKSINNLNTFREFMDVFDFCHRLIIIVDEITIPKEIEEEIKNKNLPILIVEYPHIKNRFVNLSLSSTLKEKIKKCFLSCSGIFREDMIEGIDVGGKEQKFFINSAFFSIMNDIQFKYSGFLTDTYISQFRNNEDFIISWYNDYLKARRDIIRDNIPSLASMISPTTAPLKLYILFRDVENRLETLILYSYGEDLDDIQIKKVNEQLTLDKDLFVKHFDDVNLHYMTKIEFSSEKKSSGHPYIQAYSEIKNFIQQNIRIYDFLNYHKEVEFFNKLRQTKDTTEFQEYEKQKIFEIRKISERIPELKQHLRVWLNPIFVEGRIFLEDESWYKEKSYAPGVHSSIEVVYSSAENDSFNFSIVPTLKEKEEVNILSGKYNPKFIQGLKSILFSYREEMLFGIR